MIRLANITDIPIINKIGLEFKSNFLKTYNIEDYINNSNYIVLVNEEIVLNAFMIVYKNIDLYELEMIIVDKNHQKKGIATKLMQNFLENYMKINESLILEVSVENNKALNLYKKFNFEIINTRKKYYDGKIDAYVMKKVI